ncbi:major facilitator superfamily-domain-containing protein [Phascolomyces articulosus]|uniref:Major facilitator superfamily-domain-containing protein n=1 Tax=Phascolomyces articulosus TaxID=60185 RepID=A0AAD5K2X1_9FUNG|nr:major facilitator superfamily-domain-containing protein [Phascolomyces articulosus]
MVATIIPAVTSTLSANNISSILSTVTFILHTVFLPIYSKVADKTGRAEAYSVAILLYIVAFIIMAMAPDYETLVAGQVIYALGSSGTQVLGPIVIADMTSVINRGLFQGLYSLPALICLFVAPYVAQALLDRDQWRWVYGMVPILLFVTCSPLLFGLWHVRLKQAKKNQNQSTQAADHNPPFFPSGQRLVRITNELDLIGSLLLIAALSLTLFPLVLAIPRWGGWGSAMTINTLMSGCIAWILFSLWETKFATNPILPWSTSPSFRSRTAIFGVLSCSTVTVISATNWQYFATYLQVSRKINAKEATYLERGYNVGYIIAQLIVGYLMKRNAVWRPFIWVGTMVLVLGVLLMIPARLPTSSDAFLIISQTLAGSGSGMMNIPIVVAVQSCVEYNDLAIITAFLQIGGSIAASIGSTLAGAIWNTLLPGLFKKYVPGDYDYKKIVQDINYAISLPKDQYDGVVQSYSQVQKLLTTIAAVFSVMAFLFSLPMQSFGLEKEDRHPTNDSTRTSFTRRANIIRKGSI